MPELPEVETIVKDLLKSNILNSPIAKVDVHFARIVSHPDLESFINNVKNKQIIKITRRAKYIVFHLNQGFIFVHLRMTGKFNLLTPDITPTKHEHLRLTFENGVILSYFDTRKFGRWSYADSVSHFDENLGIEPLSENFTLDAFLLLIHKHKQKLKPFLLNQKYIVGLGNIYVDEALWEAKLHPETQTCKLTKVQIKNLHIAIQKVLLKGIKNQGTSLGLGKGNYFSVTGRRGGNQYKLNVFRQEGLNCPRCGHLVVKKVVAQRGTHICPHCQIKR
jgi:formamidopyrimidine-DNA glycosylase